jgi:hypothetical protein
MKKLIIITTFLLLISMTGHGQEYRSGFGFRGGLSNGVTFKHFITPYGAIEGLLTARYHGFNVTGLYEIHTEPFNIYNLYFYYGFGGHIGSWQNIYGKHWWDDNVNHSIIGIDGIVGLEYNFRDIPFCISLDYKPGFNIIGYPKFWSDEFSLSLRYVWGMR